MGQVSEPPVPMLPELDDPYIAAPTVSLLTQTHASLAVILGEDGYEGDGCPYVGFLYSHMMNKARLGSKPQADGTRLQMLVALFSDIELTALVAWGYSLLRMWNLINEHRLGWIRLLKPGRDFVEIQQERGRRAEIITKIEIISGEEALTAYQRLTRPELAAVK